MFVCVRQFISIVCDAVYVSGCALVCVCLGCVSGSFVCV